MKLTAVKYYCSDLGNPPQRVFAIRASMNRIIFSFTVNPEMFNYSPGVFSDNQTILHSIYHIKSLLALRKMSVFLILNASTPHIKDLTVYTVLWITNLFVWRDVLAESLAFYISRTRVRICILSVLKRYQFCWEKVKFQIGF